VISLLVLTSVVIVPLLSLLFDLYLLDAARTRRRITTIAQPPPDDTPPPTQPPVTATQSGLSLRWLALKERLRHRTHPLTPPHPQPARR